MKPFAAQLIWSLIVTLAGSFALAQVGPRANDGFTVPNNYIDARDYGVKCDGVTDDSAALENALKTANSAAAMVQLPSGTCAINLVITQALGFTLDGRGVYSTTLIPYSNAPVITVNSGVAASDGVQNLTFRHFAINNAKNYTSNAILMYGSPQNVRKLFEDISIGAQPGSSAFVNPILNRGFSIWDTYNRVNIYQSVGDAITYAPGATVALSGFSIATNAGISTVSFTVRGTNDLLPGTQFDLIGFSSGPGSALNHVFFVVTSAGAKSFKAETAMCLYNHTKCTLADTPQVSDSGTAHPEAFLGGLTFERSTVQGATGRCLYVAADVTDDEFAPFSSGLQNIAFKDGTLQGCALGGAEIDNLTVSGEISNTDFESNGSPGSHPYNNLTLGGSYTRGFDLHGNNFLTPNGTGGASIDIESTVASGISITGNLIWAPRDGYTIKVNGSHIRGDLSGNGVWVGANQEKGRRYDTCDASGNCTMTGSNPLVLATHSFNASTQTSTPNVAEVNHLDFYNPGTLTIVNFAGAYPGEHVFVTVQGAGTVTFSGPAFSMPHGPMLLMGGEAAEFWLDSAGHWFPVTAYAKRDDRLNGVTGSIGGTALSAGQCSAGTATLPASATGRPGIASATDGTVQGNYKLDVSVIGNIATVSVCAITPGTPTAKTYNVSVF
ncbi:MAG TPA: glycosyl hydrolase family 28-related protein [Terracidiphilus sp.]|nr:glycosyl hydrolase family 28-related protein [Terracidiphilus sp.]